MQTVAPETVCLIACASNFFLLMVFPQETVEQARQIGRLLDLRYQRNASKAFALYEGNFLHIQYGFDDAVRKGRCGTFLHEVERTAECFSLAGILYIVAREMNMDPRMFYALGMKDVVEGGDPGKYGMYDHAFITVGLGKDRFIIDPYFGRFGKVRHNETSHVLQVVDGQKITNRSYAYLHNLSEEEYVAILEKNRAPGGGRLALASSQQVQNGKYAVHLEFSDDTLRSSGVFRRFQENADPEATREIYCLQAPVLRNGEVRLEEGVFSHCMARNAGWKRSHYDGVINEFHLPASMVLTYLRHMETVGKNSGRVTPLRTASVRRMEEILSQCGMDRFGNLVAENGVDKRDHGAVLDAIDASFETRQSDELSLHHLDRRALYLRHSMELTTPQNPRGFLYTAEEHLALSDSFIDNLAQQNAELISSKKIAFKALTRKGSARKCMRQLHILDAQYEEQQHVVGGLIETRQIHENTFRFLIDWQLFTQKTPLGSANVTDAERRLEYRRFFHELMLPGLRVIPALQVKKHRKGLQRILQE